MQRGFLILAFLAVALIGYSVMTKTDEYDLVIRKGKVIDGTGNPSFVADIAIRDGKIVEIGRVSGAGKKEIDAAGKWVTPGFIDVHTHAENIESLPLAENFLRMGVSTVIIGNCGGSELSLGDYFARMEKKGFSANIASLIGHNTIRRQAMGGVHNRPPSEAELEAMKNLVDRAMNDGAVGLSTGLIYLPGTYSKTPEIVELAKVAAHAGGIYASHMRSEGLQILSAIDELLTIGREANIKCELSHIKLSGNAMWGKSAEILAKLEQAREEGVDVTQDLYAYTASSTTLSQLIPDEYLEKGVKGFAEIMQDPLRKELVKNQMRRNLANNKREDYTYAVIASYTKDKSLNGLSIPQAAEKRFGSKELDKQMELIFEIYLNGGGSGVFHGIYEEDMQAFMKHPFTAIASDSSARDFQVDVPHPRGYGNNARVLQRYVYELKVLRLEDAIRKMTSLPAQSMQIRDRGVLRVGMAADINIFDLSKVKENTTFTSPHAYATGMEYVLVNGVVTIEADKHSGQRAGRILRNRNGNVLSVAARDAKQSNHPADVVLKSPEVDVCTDH